MNEEEEVKEQLKLFPLTLDFDYHHLKTQVKVQEIIDKLQLDDKDTQKNNQEKIYIYNFISFLFYLLRNFDTALEYCNKSLVIDPDDLTAIVNQCHFLLAKEDFYSAQKVKQILLEAKNKPDFAKNKYYAKAGLAYAYSRSGPWYHQKGATLYEEILQVYPEKNNWKFGLGLTLIRQTHLFISLRENVRQHEGVLLSNAARHLLDVTQNTEKTDKVLCGKAWTQLGRILHANKFEAMDIPEELKGKESKYCFERALEICPSEPFIMETSGKYYRYFKEIEKSEELLRNSIKLHETCFAYHQLALTLKTKVQTRKNSKRFTRSVSYPRYTYPTNAQSMRTESDISASFSSMSLSEKSPFPYDGNQRKNLPAFCVPRVSPTITQNPRKLNNTECHGQPSLRADDFYMSSGHSIHYSGESEYSLPRHSYDNCHVLESDTRSALKLNENNFPSTFTSGYMTMDSVDSNEYSEHASYQRPSEGRTPTQRNQGHVGHETLQESEIYSPDYSNYNVPPNQRYQRNRITQPRVSRNILRYRGGQRHSIGYQPQQFNIPPASPTFVQNPEFLQYENYNDQPSQIPNEADFYLPTDHSSQNQQYCEDREYSTPFREQFNASHTYDNYHILESDTCNVLQQNESDFPSTFTSGYMTTDSMDSYRYSEHVRYQRSRRGRNPRQRTKTQVGPETFQESEPYSPNCSVSSNQRCQRNRRITQPRVNRNTRKNSHGQRHSIGSYSELPTMPLLERSVNDKQLSKLLTSPMKMKAYPEDETLLEAVELLKKARKISDGMLIKYQLAIIYRMLDKPDQALDTLDEITNQTGSVLTKFGFVTVYEQKGMCLLELGNRSSDPDERQRLKENGKMMLFKAVEQQAKIIKEDKTFKNVWEAYYTLKSLLQADEGQQSKLAKLHSIMFEPEEAIKLLENLKQNDGTLNIEDYKVMVESYVAAENYTEAVVQLKLLECAKDFEKMDKGMFVGTYILGALHSIKENDLPTVQTRFRSAYNIARSSKFQMQRLPDELLSPMMCMEKEQKHQDEEAAIYELLIIHKCQHGDNCSAAKKIKDILKKYTDLTVTVNTEDFLGVLALTAMLETISASENVLILLQDKENAEADIYFHYALKNPKKIMVAAVDDGLIPTILDTPNIPVIRFPSDSCKCDGITCNRSNDNATKEDYETDMDILNALFKVLCTTNKSLKA